MIGISLMSVCKLYFVLLLLYAVINLLGERLQTAQTEERWEKGRGEVTSISVSVLLFQKDIQESDFIFVFLCVFRTECTYWDAEDFVVSKFCEISSPGETACINPWEPLSLTHLNHLHLGLRYCFIFWCSNGSEAVFCFWPHRTQATLQICNG